MTTVLLIIILALVFLAILRVATDKNPAAKKNAPPAAQGSSTRTESPDRPESQVSSKGRETFKKALKISVGERFPEVALNRVPSVPKKYFGRKNIIADLSPLSGQNSLVIGFHGPSGIGKTLLGAAMTKHLRAKYPNEPVYIDMRGTSMDSLSPEEVTARVIRHFRPKDKLPEPPMERARWYRALLNQQKIVVFLDNVPESADIRSLMPPKNCALLAVSRKPLTLPGLVSRMLPPLTDSEAQGLLNEASPRTGFWANEIAKICGHFPLTLLLAANYLTVNPRDPSLFVESLREELKRLKPAPEEQAKVSLECVMNTSYRYLSEKNASVFRKLVIFPQSFDPRAEAFICEDEDNQFLGNLLMQGFIISEKNTNRYSLHDYTRSFLRKRLKDSEKFVAKKRLATYYLTLLLAADELYASGGKDAARGLNLFDAEWENIKTGQEWAETNSKNDGEVDQLCLSYTEAAFSLLSLRHPAQERILWFEAALNSAKRLNDAEAEAKYLLWMGIEHNRLKRHQDALDYLEQALERSSHLEDKTAERNALGHLGLTHLALGKPHQAIELIEKQLKLFNGAEDSTGEESALQSLGEIYFQVGESKRALEYYKEELKKAREREDLRRQARILGDLGRIHTATGDHEPAIEHFEQGLALARKAGDKEKETFLLKQLGDSFTQSGKIKKGLPYYEQALALALQRKDQNSVAGILGQIGQSHLQSKNFREAIKYFQKASPLVKSLGDKIREAEILWGWGQAEALGENFPKAILKAGSALGIYRRLKHADAATIERQIQFWKGEEEPEKTDAGEDSEQAASETLNPSSS